MSKDEDYKKLIHTTRWLRLRRTVLTAQPLCEQCKKDGLLTPATEVHHRVPVETALDFAAKARLMYDIGNLMALCRRCHRAIHATMWHARADELQQRRDTQRVDAIAKLYGDEPGPAGGAEDPGGCFLDGGSCR